MIQVRDDWVCLPGVVTGIEYRINVIAVYNFHPMIIDSDRLGVITVLNSDAGYFLIRTRRMRVLFSKELPILKNSPCFFEISVYESIKHNVSHSHLANLCKPYKPDYLLSISAIYEKIEQPPAVYDKNNKLDVPLTVDFFLSVLSDVPECQISTTIMTLLREIFAACIVMEGLRHLLCRQLPTGNEPMVLKMGLAMSICRAQGKIENEYVFVSDLMIVYACFTFGFANISKSKPPVVRQSSYFQPEGHSCYGH